MPPGRVYRVDEHQSELRILVYRAGPLARLGHNHVIVNHAIRGAVSLADVAGESGFQLSVPVAGFVVDDREVRKEGPSYSVETLAELRHEYPDRSICLIVGMDAFLSLPKWHQWQDLLQLAHLVVAHRPGWRAPGMGPLGELLVDRGTGRINDLHESRSGCIFIHAVTQLEISSTEVRQLIAMGRDPRFLMPDPVRKLILDTHCYSRNRTT